MIRVIFHLFYLLIAWLLIEGLYMSSTAHIQGFDTEVDLCDDQGTSHTKHLACRLNMLVSIFRVFVE